MSRRKEMHTLFFMAADMIAVIFSFVVAFWAREWISEIFDLLPLGHGLTLYLSKWWIPLIILVTIWFRQGYGIIVNGLDEFNVITKSIALAFLVVWMALSLQKEAETVSRIIVTGAFAAMIVFIPFFRFAIRAILYRWLDLRVPAVLLERRKGERGMDLQRSLNKEWYSGFKISENIYRESLKGPYETCFVPLESTDEATMRTVKPQVKNLIIVSTVSGLAFMNTEIKSFHAGNMAYITTRNGLLSPQRLFVKRVFDICAAATGLLLFLPLLVAIAIIIRVESPGPVLFRHGRCGRKMEPLMMIKFRTMRADGDKILKDYLKSHPNAVEELADRNKLENDPRVTPVGRFLRRTSFDELPQLINVLAGTMSIVGPRPDTREAIEKYYTEYSEIYENIKPGITGLWQISGRSMINYAQRVKLDYIYMLNWSLWFDFVIIVKTFKALITGRGAY